MTTRRRTLATSAAFVAFGLAACTPADNNANKTGTNQVAQNSDSTAHKDSILQVEKDSLMLAAKSLFDAMSAIDSASSAAGYKAPKHGQTEPLQRYEVQVRDRTLKALARLKVAEARLKASVAKVSKLSGDNEQLNAQLTQFRQTADALQLQLSSQQARGDSLVAQLTVANARNDTLTNNNKELNTTVDSFTVASRKAFVIAGSKDYLIQHSLVNEVGGSRFPFIVRVGGTLRPASAHLDSTLFKPIDRVEDRVINLDSTRQYEVVSSQDLDGADRSNAKGRVFRGSIRITDPKRFWTPSAYLILREL